MKSNIHDLCLNQILEWILKVENTHKPLMVMIGGPQGSGKTTLCNQLVHSLESEHQLCAFQFSLDDFYLPFKEQFDLFHSYHPDNELLRFRGNAGTHDMVLLKKVLKQASMLSSKNDKTNCEDQIYSSTVVIPKYDKYLNNGLGDRLPVSEWTSINSSHQVDVVIFEGWMLGFQSLSPQQISSLFSSNLQSSSDAHFSTFNGIPLKTLLNHTENSIQFINNELKKFESQIYPYFHAFIHIYTQNIHENVLKWRIQAESHNFPSVKPKVSSYSDESDYHFPAGREKQQQQIQQNENDSSEIPLKSQMDEVELKEFISRFMPAYELYLGQSISFNKKLHQNLSCGFQLSIELDDERNVIQTKLL